jgi:diaminohydroxyphosphoribosylaminopyrimidine deaminase/5-amino-6-(5-phosphoribosylamino)uracil reductase
MAGDNDLKFMNRCLDLAAKAEGMTFPNPLVGAVIVHQGKIIGEGYHLKAGSPHAEVNAIESVKDRKLLASSVMYVNLEPCSHFGQTPPCADLIISYKIPEVVVGTTDTSGKVSGKGIADLTG